MPNLTPATYLGDYIHGTFVRSKEPSGEIRSVNPGNLRDTVGVFGYFNDHVYEAVAAAKQAFLSWSALPLSERVSYFKKFSSELEAHLEDLSWLISRETGKPLWEAQQETKAMISKIHFTCEEGIRIVADSRVPEAQPGIPGLLRFKPKGVMAVIGPFNFPAHLPHGHYVPALLTGNTVVFKPSEKTPAVGQMIAEIIHRSGFPPGVFNMIQGEREIGKRLCLANVDAILFTGSYEVGLKIKRDTVSHFWKTVVLEMGGKNAAIILDDAELQKALYENAMGAFLTSGQRCSATSRIILTAGIAPRFIERFHGLVKNIKIGYAFDEDPPFMGPLISEEARDNYLRFQGIAQREGGETVMRGKALELKPSGYYVTPSIYLMRPKAERQVYLSTEIFGPSVGIIVVDDLEGAIEEANKTEYGLATSVFTRDRGAYEAVFHRTKTGIVNYNRSTAGASSRLPFGGQGKSGNQFPTALFAPYYCTYPVASLEDSNPVEKAHMPPGFPFFKSEME